MPAPYPLHGSGSGYRWGALPSYLVLRSIKNLSYLLIGFRYNFGSILGSIWEPLGAPFGVKIDPRSVQDALPSLIFFKNTMFTKTL